MLKCGPNGWDILEVLKIIKDDINQPEYFKNSARTMYDFINLYEEELEHNQNPGKTNFRSKHFAFMNIGV